MTKALEIHVNEEVSCADTPEERMEKLEKNKEGNKGTDGAAEGIGGTEKGLEETDHEAHGGEPGTSMAGCEKVEGDHRGGWDCSAQQEMWTQRG